MARSKMVGISKPHLRRGLLWYRGKWLCIKLPIGRGGHGIGDTPAAAFADYQGRLAMYPRR